jgi:predicted DNA-binding transcriptional regulator YafY
MTELQLTEEQARAVALALEMLTNSGEPADRIEAAEEALAAVLAGLDR